MGRSSGDKLIIVSNLPGYEDATVIPVKNLSGIRVEKVHDTFYKITCRNRIETGISPRGRFVRSSFVPSYFTAIERNGRPSKS